MNPSSNLFLIGPTGAGKTSIGRRLAAHYGLPFVDLDGEIQTHTGVDIPRIFEVEGEPGFRQRETALLDELSKRQGMLLATGAGAILDADNRERLAARGFVLWLDATVEQQLARLAHDQQRPLLALPDRDQRLRAMAISRTPLYRMTADLHLPGHDESVEQASRRTLRALKNIWAQPQAATP